MLAHILALVVGLISFGLYMSAFFFPEVYRKSDFTWSGVGLFYALVLWVCAGRITGSVLLGQTASVALLGWLGWQTIALRHELAPSALRTPLPGNTKTIGQAIQFKLSELRSRWQQTALAEQTNRLAGTIAGWTGGISRSVAKPKKQPPVVGSRKRSAPAAIAPSQPAEADVVVSEPVVADGSGTVANEAIAPEPPAPQPVTARPSRGLFGGLRRNPAKAQPAKPRSIPAPASTVDLDELEDWDEAEAVEASAPASGAIEAEIDAEVMVEASSEAAIEEVVVVETDGAIEEVIVVVETDAPPVVEIVEVEVIELPPEAEPAAIDDQPKAAEPSIEVVEGVLWPDTDDAPPEGTSHTNEPPSSESIEPPAQPPA